MGMRAGRIRNQETNPRFELPGQLRSFAPPLPTGEKEGLSECVGSGVELLVGRV